MSHLSHGSLAVCFPVFLSTRSINIQLSVPENGLMCSVPRAFLHSTWTSYRCHLALPINKDVREAYRRQSPSPSPFKVLLSRVSVNDGLGNYWGISFRKEQPPRFKWSNFLSDAMRLLTVPHPVLGTHHLFIQSIHSLHCLLITNSWLSDWQSKCHGVCIEVRVYLIVDPNRIVVMLEIQMCQRKAIECSMPPNKKVKVLWLIIKWKYVCWDY